MKRYQFYSSILNVANNNLGKGYYSKTVMNKMIQSFTGSKFVMKKEDKIGEIQIDYKAKYGDYPPGFIVLAPSQRCNLHCTGCYAGSTSRTVSTIPYSVVDRIIGDVHDVFGRKFVVITGGEPFMYKSDGKTLLDIFEKYIAIFFLVYTNGTLITPSIAQRLSELGNVTPAISVEGYEQETDERRGKGVYNKIMKAMENLRKAGVPFGISVTATSENFELLLTEEFYNYYFEELGVSYMWQFQLMPCSIRDHYKNFRENILTDNAKPEDIQAAEAIKDPIYFQSMVSYDEELTKSTEKMNEPEFADVLQKT